MKMVGRTCIWAAILFSVVTVLTGLPGNAFAEARVWADFNGDGFDDLAIGVQDESIGSINSAGAGAVNVIYGSIMGINSANNQFWSQDSPGILDVAEPGDGFGSFLTSGDFDGNGFDDFAIGVPLEDIFVYRGTSSFSRTDAGAVNVIYGSASRLISTGNQYWNQNSINIEDSAEDDDLFGFRLSN